MTKVLVTGGAGYVGSLLTGVLLAAGHDVTAVDCLMFGGESILPYFTHPGFRFHKADVTAEDLDDLLDGVNSVFHLAAIVGFPACQQVGEIVAYRYNTNATQRVSRHVNGLAWSGSCLRRLTAIMGSRPTVSP